MCYCRFFQSDVLRNYDTYNIDYLHFRTLHSRRHVDVLFLINVFKGKTNCCSILDNVGIRMPTRQIEFSTFTVSSELKHSPSARCVIDTKDIRRFFDIFDNNNIYFKGTFSARETVYIPYFVCT
jgi:hypothetical protein